MSDTETAKIDYGYKGSKLVCPCGVRQDAGFTVSDRTGAPKHDIHWCLVTCNLCGRIITRDGVVIGRRELTAYETDNGPGGMSWELHHKDRWVASVGTREEAVDRGATVFHTYADWEAFQLRQMNEEGKG